MERRTTWGVSALALAALASFGAPAAVGAPVGPVVNGEFELYAPAKDIVCTVFGDFSVDILPDRNPWLLHVEPCESSAVKALWWSTPATTQFADFDGDGDREARMDGAPGPAADLVQTYASPHQLYTANFEALTFRVEGGAPPAGAAVRLALSVTPYEAITPDVPFYIDCVLTFPVAGARGVVRADPVGAWFGASSGACKRTAHDWAATGPEGRRTILSRLRIVELSFAGMRGVGPVVLDGIDLAGARTIAEDHPGL